MNENRGTTTSKPILAALTLAVLLLWMGLHASILFTSQHGTVRCVLTSLFAVLILLRPKTKAKDAKTVSSLLTATVGGIGFVCVAVGLVGPIRQLEWIGILLLVFAGGAWTLPTRYARDLPWALFVLYWANPLPTQWFGLLQIGMQIASVEGSEWLLHMLNVRVWADGLILQTGLHTFEVPAWCSGMRTATTVFILSLALGILRRLRWYETVVLIVWSLFHALILNILRISAMVIFSPKTSGETGIAFLHDTAGLIVIAGVLVVYFEMLHLERRRRRQEELRNELNPERMDSLSEFPPFWHTLNQNRTRIAWGVALVAAAAALGYRSRPYHRAMMVKDVAITLRDQGELSYAQRAASVVSSMIPGDTGWRFTAIRLHLISGRYERVLSELNAMTDLDAMQLIQKRVLMAYALMSLGRIDEAAEIVELLPEKIRDSDPRVAMILAEMALRGGDTDGVAIHIVTAAGWAPNVGRIRNLYPYLRIHRQWKAMAASDIEIPYHDPVQALSILEAYMNLNRAPKVADITLQAITRWPRDIRILEPLFFMAVKRGGGEWEDRFGQHLLRTLTVHDNPDQLYETLYKCFKLSRPDLAWAIYRRIHELDPTHPSLAMGVAKYGHQWFAFRKRRLGIPAATSGETIDLKPLFLAAQWFPEWERIASDIPHGAALCVEATTPVRKRFLAEAVENFRPREKENALTLDMQYLYVLALEMSGRVDLARQQLERIVERYPEEKEAARVVLSEVYERKGDWINVYETLRTYLEPRDPEKFTPELETVELNWPPDNIPRPPDDIIHLGPLLRLVKAQLELRLGLAAVHSAREAVRLYPYSPRATELLATALFALGQPEEALHALDQPRVRELRHLDLLEARALFETERYGELLAFGRQALLPQIRIPPDTVQRTSLPPAEMAVLWHRVAIPSEAQFAENATHLRGNLSSASPGLRKLLELWLAAYDKHCEGDLANPNRWIACGRDAMERAIALNQLTLLLCREERYAEAEVAARKAVTAMPEMPMLRQILISLSGVDADVVDRARKACPDDAELWLAELVVRAQPTPDGDVSDLAREQRDRWITQTVTDALDAGYPPAALTRAGEFLWRADYKADTVRIARDLTERGRGLLPAYILTTRAALHERDEAWALRSTQKAIEAALQPLPEFYENLVSLKSSDGDIDTDPDMVNALRHLRKSDPDNPIWPQMLGYIRFQRGGWEIIDALFEMNVAIAGGATNRAPYLIASEVSRLLQNYDRAADVLNQGLKHSPGHPSLLNNLAYTLSHDAKRIAEALALVPQLQEIANRDPHIKDTLAVVFLRGGKLDDAQRIVTEILSNADAGSPLWFRGNMHLAEIAWKRGRPREARVQLEGLLKSAKHIPDEDILAANSLLAQVMGESAEYINPMRAFVKEQLNGDAPRPE